MTKVVLSDKLKDDLYKTWNAIGVDALHVLEQDGREARASFLCDAGYVAMYGSEESHLELTNLFKRWGHEPVISAVAEEIF